MKNEIIEFVENFCSDTSNRMDIIHFEESLNNKKSLVITFEDSKMISVEIVPEKSCDLMIVEIDSENLIGQKTIELKNDSETLKEVVIFFKSIIKG